MAESEGFSAKYAKCLIRGAKAPKYADSQPPKWNTAVEHLVDPNSTTSALAAPGVVAYVESTARVISSVSQVGPGSGARSARRPR